jgi:STE24 endopeptidase
MEKILLAVFLILFIGRMALRYVLQWFNTRHLKTHGREIPPVFRDEIDETTLHRMVDYTFDQSRLESREHLSGDAIELAVIFLLLPPGVAWLSSVHIHLIVQALIFFAGLAIISGAAGLPFDIYHTFVLEKKYGFSTITWKLWLADLFKSVLISAILMTIIVSALMSFVLYLPQSWWFWGWMFFTLFQLTLLWLYPVLIAPLFNKFEPVRDAELRGKILALLAKAGIEAKGIYQVDEGKRSRHTNAYFTGIGKTKRIVLYDTLLASHTHEEIVSVLAHEIGHWKKKHVLKQLAFMVIASLFLFYFVYVATGYLPLYGAFGIDHTPVYAGLFLLSLYLGAAGFFLAPLGTAITRHFEREADRMAYELTGTTRPMLSALKRLAKDNLSNLHPHPWYVIFYYSHPPLTERIEYLQAMDYKKENV